MGLINLFKTKEVSVEAPESVHLCDKDVDYDLDEEDGDQFVTYHRSILFESNGKVNTIFAVIVTDDVNNIVSAVAYVKAQPVDIEFYSEEFTEKKTLTENINDAVKGLNEWYADFKKHAPYELV